MVIFFECSVPVSAASQVSSSDEETIYVSEISTLTDGFMYLFGTETKCVAILANQDSHQVAASLIPSGTSNKYLCRSIVSRYTYVGSLTTPCNTTSKYLDYYGIDDGDLTSSNPGYIYSGRTTSYSHSSSYFSNYSQQAEDAYYYYLAYYA